MSKLEFINKVFMQWLFIRLARVRYSDREGKINKKGWAIISFIWPLSGWTNDFKIIGKYRVWHFIKPKISEVED